MAGLLLEVMAGLLIVTSLLAIRLYRGKPSSNEEWSEVAYLAVVGFINGFMVAYLAPFFPSFAARFLFHLFLYLLLASTTVLYYLAYKGYYDVKVFAVALAPWYLALVLALYARLAGLRTIFFF